MASGDAYSLVTTKDGRVLAFGSNGDIQEEDSDGEELDEPGFDVDGRLGLGAGVVEALTPTAIDGIAMRRERGRKGRRERDGPAADFENNMR